jgi:TPP-dependent pyruvate/acetoin dehydrogenase alpha subunit
VEKFLMPTVPQNDLLLDLFKTMLTIRIVEETLLALFSKGVLRGTVHTCIGQEACAVGVISALDRSRDIVCSNHRGHGHFLAYSDDVEGLLAEIMGKPSGVCGGIGGSQHLHKGNFYSNGILGGMVPVAAGMALAEKIQKSSAVTTVFLGDGAFGEGVVYETLNIAALWKLPLLFVVEDNGFAQSTPTHLEHAGALEMRASPMGIPIVVLDGNNVLAVHEASLLAISKIRHDEGPQLLFLKTYRLGPHSKGDDPRDPNEIESHKKNDPILLARKNLDPTMCEQIEKEVRQRIEGILKRLL